MIRQMVLEIRLWLAWALVSVLKGTRPFWRMLLGAGGRQRVLGVLPQGGAGWILDAICREMSPYTPAGVRRFFGVRRLPPVGAYFVTHYSLVPEMALVSPWAFAFGQISIFYTHPREVSTGERMMMRFLGLVDRVGVMNSASRSELVAKGIPADKIEVVHCGASPEFFSCRVGPRRDGRVRVGVSSAYYERKNPDLLLELVSGMPNHDFILVGRNWEKYSRYSELCGLPNLKIQSLQYSEYPEFYRSLDVLLSISSVEGGPVPLIEAMMSGVPVVATRTGFAPDIVREGVNGKVVPIGPALEQVRAAIDEVLGFPPAAIRRSVEHLDWPSFTRRALGGLIP